MSWNPDEIYYTCVDETVYKYTNQCKDKHDQSRCSVGANNTCFWAYPYGESKKHQHEERACRTVPKNLIEGEFKFSSRRVTENKKKGQCGDCSSDQTCAWSWLKSDERKGKGCSAMWRCKA